MMYYLYYLSLPPHVINTGFNVFQYISFRAVCAAMTAFLLGPDAAAITGQQIVMCGGGSL